MVCCDIEYGAQTQNKCFQYFTLEEREGKKTKCSQVHQIYIGEVIHERRISVVWRNSDSQSP